MTQDGYENKAGLVQSGDRNSSNISQFCDHHTADNISTVMQTSSGNSSMVLQ